MQIHIEPLGGTLVAMVEGRIDGTNAMDFHGAVIDALGDDSGPLLIDFENVSYISSAGLRVVLSLAKTLQQRAGKFAICSLSGMIAQIFQTSGFDRIISTHATREDALGQLGG